MSEPFIMPMPQAMRSLSQRLAITDVLGTVADRTGMNRGLVKDVMTPLTAQGINTLQDAARLSELTPDLRLTGLSGAVGSRSAEISKTPPFPRAFADLPAGSDPLPGLAPSIRKFSGGLNNKGIILYQPKPGEDTGDKGIILYQPKPGESIPDNGIILYQPRPGAGIEDSGIILYQPKPESGFTEGITLRPAREGEGISDQGIILYHPKPGEGIILYQPKPESGGAREGIILYQPKPEMLESSGLGELKPALTRMGNMISTLNEVQKMDRALDLSFIRQYDI